MARLKIVRRYTLPTLQARREQLLELVADGVEEMVSELELVETLLKLGEEEGELDFYEEEIVAYDPKIHSRLFSPKIVRLLSEIGENVESISDLARRVNRDVSNVWRDLKYLVQNRIVSLVRMGGRVKPILLAVEIAVSLE